MFTVYQTTNLVNQKIYIGIHKCMPNCRHIRNGRCQYFGSGTVIVKALAKYGKENFSKKILFEFQSKEEAILKEKELVTEIFVADNSTYNQTVGGNMPPNMLGYKHTEETKEKISNSMTPQKRLAASVRCAQTIEKRKIVGKCWSEAEIQKRVATRKKKGSYSSTMKECNTREAIERRVSTRKERGSYSQDLEYLKDPMVVFNRTKTRILKQIAEGKKFSPSTLQKYGISLSTSH